MTLMKKAELARKLGVSKAYISKLINQGRLVDQNGLVDDESIMEWRNLKQRLLEVKLQNEIQKGALLRAKVKEETKKFIPASEVKECLERKGKIIREEMLKLPRKLCHKIAALGNRDAIHALLTQEIRAALLRICEQN